MLQLKLKISLLSLVLATLVHMLACASVLAVQLDPLWKSILLPGIFFSAYRNLFWLSGSASDSILKLVITNKGALMHCAAFSVKAPLPFVQFHSHLLTIIRVDWSGCEPDWQTSKKLPLNRAAQILLLPDSLTPDQRRLLDRWIRVGSLPTLHSQATGLVDQHQSGDPDLKV